MRQRSRFMTRARSLERVWRAAGTATTFDIDALNLALFFGEAAVGLRVLDVGVGACARRRVVEDTRENGATVFELDARVKAIEIPRGALVLVSRLGRVKKDLDLERALVALEGDPRKVVSVNVRLEARVLTPAERRRRHCQERRPDQGRGPAFQLLLRRSTHG